MRISRKHLKAFKKLKQIIGKTLTPINFNNALKSDRKTYTKTKMKKEAKEKNMEVAFRDAANQHCLNLNSKLSYP